MIDLRDPSSLHKFLSYLYTYTRLGIQTTSAVVPTLVIPTPGPAEYIIYICVGREGGGNRKFPTIWRLEVPIVAGFTLWEFYDMVVYCGT